MKNKIIELKGVGTANKGAHLMLNSILEEFSKRNKQEEFCIEPGFGMDFFKAGENGLYLKENFKGKKLPWAKIMSLLPEKTLKKYGLILDKQIDVVLDGSGFAYGDFWGAKKIEDRLNNFINKKTSQNSKLILLPQALGPFENHKVKTSFEKVVDCANLILARDEVSYSYLVKSYGKRNNIKLAPDFTNLLFSGNERNYKEGNVCIIPNYKMLSKKEDKENYYSFLEGSIIYLQNKEKKPYFLIHEGLKDRDISSDINKRLKNPIPIVEPEDPIEIKNRIKSSDLIIVSRFHGLVSALSQGIPAITTSWSHKYKELLGDYNLEKNLIDISDFKPEKVNNLISDILNIPKEDYYNNQKGFIEKEKNKSNEMWNLVFKTIYG